MRSDSSIPYNSNINLEGVNLDNQIHPTGFPPLTGEILTDIIQRIAVNNQVKKIILFGSYAGLSCEPTSDSDIDLLVIMETSLPRAEKILTITHLLRPRPFPMDILVRTPEEITEMMESGNVFFNEVMIQGKVLFER